MTYFGDADDEQATVRSCEVVSVILRLLTSSFQHDCEAFLTNEVVSQLEQPLVDQVRTTFVVVPSPSFNVLIFTHVHIFVHNAFDVRSSKT